MATPQACLEMPFELEFHIDWRRRPRGPLLGLRLSRPLVDPHPI
jgi:hypothetical protein